MRSRVDAVSIYLWNEEYLRAGAGTLGIAPLSVLEQVPEADTCIGP